MGEIVLGFSVFSMVFGVLTLTRPQSLMSRVLHREVVSLDKVVVKYHVGVGVCLILASIFLFSYGYYLGWL